MFWQRVLTGGQRDDTVYVLKRLGAHAGGSGSTGAIREGRPAEHTAPQGAGVPAEGGTRPTASSDVNRADAEPGSGGNAGANGGELAARLLAVAPRSRSMNPRLAVGRSTLPTVAIPFAGHQRGPVLWSRDADGCASGCRRLCVSGGPPVARSRCRLRASDARTTRPAPGHRPRARIVRDGSRSTPGPRSRVDRSPPRPADHGWSWSTASDRAEELRRLTGRGAGSPIRRERLGTSGNGFHGMACRLRYLGYAAAEAVDIPGYHPPVGKRRRHGWTVSAST